MTKLPLLFAFFALLFCVSCYKENRIKPIYKEETKYYSQTLSKPSYSIENLVDSNSNNYLSSFILNLNLSFTSRGSFFYKINYQFYDDIFLQQKNWITSKPVLINESFNYSERVFINVDSILKSESKTSSRIRFSVQLIDEKG